MKAIRLRAPKNIGVEEVAQTPRTENQISIKVHSLGICGSDVGAYLGVNPLVSYPRIIGHEVAGEIIAAGTGEKEFSVGDHVVLEPYVYCGKCYPCQNNRTNCCENLTVLGVHIDGAMAEQFSHPRHLVHKVPKAAPWEWMAMVEPLTISMHAIHRAKVKEGEHVAINGSGPIGLLAAQYATAIGAIPIVIDPVDDRLKFAKGLGMHTINPVIQEPVAAIKKITAGRMAEAVIEASGNAAAIRSTIDYVAYSGRIVFVGWPKQEVTLPTAMFTKKELAVAGSRNSYQEFPESIELIASGKVNVKAVISRTIAFDEIPATVKNIAENPGNYLKVNALLD